MIDRLKKGICSRFATIVKKELKFKLYKKLSSKSATRQKNGQTHSQRNSGSKWTYEEKLNLLVTRERKIKTAMILETALETKRGDRIKYTAWYTAWYKWSLHPHSSLLSAPFFPESETDTCHWNLHLEVAWRFSGSAWGYLVSRT